MPFTQEDINMIKEYAKQNKEAALQTIRQLCAIPAPSLNEKERAEYCKAVRAET